MDDEKKAAVFDIGAADAIDESRMEVMVGGKGTDWFWIFAGPGHPKGIAQRNRLAREELNKQRLREQQQANGKKVKVPDRSFDEVTGENIDFVMERLIGWSDATNGDQPFPFTDENARALLGDARKRGILLQAIEFINDDASFTPPSAKS